jgi:hypothetical protein
MTGTGSFAELRQLREQTWLPPNVNTRCKTDFWRLKDSEGLTQVAGFAQPDGDRRQAAAVEGNARRRQQRVDDSSR